MRIRDWSSDVCSSDDVRRIMDEEGVHVPVIAKIEKPQAIENIDGIVKAFDGLMVARGDLGVECPLEDVPFLQKRLIEKARRRSEERRVGKEWVSTCRYRGWPDL